MKNNKFVFIAGPCVIEDEVLTRDIASFLKELAEKNGLDFYFKASYDKANRSSIHSFRGPGQKNGLKLLAKIKEDLNVKILSDVHSAGEVDEASKVLDFLQIPAFLCRQTDIITSCAKAMKPTNIKKGQFLSPWEVKNIVEKYKYANGKSLFITERGTSFGYNNLVVDFRSISIIKENNVPVIYDVTHSCQLPGASGSESGGMRRFSRNLALAAAACDIDGIFMEVHPKPDEALCDKATILPYSMAEEIIEKVMEIKNVIS